MKEHGSFNRCYRLLWSGTTEQWKPVPETARTAKKGGRGKAANTLTLAGVLPGVAMGLFVMSNLAAQPPPAPPTTASAPATTQLPTGGTVAAGQATISQSAIATAANMVVNQTSQRAVIDWSNFNVGSGATVQFVQPNAQSVILNRVLDANPTQVFGRINANGQVFLTNPYGVYFAPTASVDVGGLVATTYSISNDDFMAGRYTFNRNGSTARVVNEGNLSASLGGYIALLAPEVQNSGVVLARAGTVAMAAGEQISLSIADGKGLSGISTTASAIASLIDNRLAVQAPDGQIILSAVAVNKLQAGVIKNSGSLQATSLSNQGGKIVLEADEIELTSTASIDVSGRTRGGTVLMGGDWQGSGDLRQATTVRMAAGATINANATDNGDGGKVVLWSNVTDPNSTTTVAGSIYASAGPNGGNGGQVETSGYAVVLDNPTVIASGTNGKAGVWLTDPTYADSTINSTVATTYVNALSNGTSVIDSVTGNLTVSNAINVTSTNATIGNLTLVATGDINIQANISLKGTGTGAGSFTANAAGNVFLSGNTSAGSTATSITTTGGSVSLYSNSGGATTATPSNGGAGIKAYSGSVINTSGGAINLGSTGATGYAQGGSGANQVGVYLINTTLNSSGGDINISGSGAYQNTWQEAGIQIDSGSGAIINAGAGNITLTGRNHSTATWGSAGQQTAFGIFTNGNATTPINITSTGTITLNGAAGFNTSSATSNYDVNLVGAKINNGTNGVTVVGDRLGFSDSSFNVNALYLNPITAGNTPTIALSGSATVFNISTATTLGNTISGSGCMTQAGSGALTLTANNSGFTGNLAINSGTQLNINSSADVTLSGLISSSGNLTQQGTGNLTLTGNSTGFTGKLNINTGSNVTIGNGATSGIVNASIANNGTLNFNRTDAVTNPGAISGTGVLNKFGSNVLTLSGNSTFTGNITVGAGTLKAGFAGSTTYGAFGNQTNITLTDLSGVGLDISGFSTSIGSLTGGANNTLNLGASTLTTGLNGLSTTYAGTVLGSGTLSKSGAGTFNLSGNSSTFTGGVVISAGDLVLTNTSVIGSGAQLINISGATGMLELQNISSFSNPVCISAVGATLNISGGNTTMNSTLTMCNALGNTIRIAQNSSLTNTGNLSASNSDVKKYGLGTWIVAEPSVSNMTQVLYSIDVYEGRAELNSTKWYFGSTAAPSIAANATLKLGAFAGYNVFNQANSATITNNGALQFAPSSTSYNSWVYYVNGTGSVEFMGSVPTLITNRQLAYTGSTTIFPNATVWVDEANSHLGNSSQAILNNGNLTITSGNTQNWVQGITGSGNVTFDAADPAGTVVTRPLGMKAANSYTGTTTLTDRVKLYVGGLTSCTTNASLGTGDIIFQGINSTLCITRTSDITLTNNMSGPGSINLNSANVTTTLAGNVNIGGNITLNGSNTTLVIAPTGSLGASGVFAGSIIFNTTNTTLEYASASDVCITGNLSGGYGRLRKTTSNSNMTLTGNDNFGSGAWIEAGAVYALGANTSSGKLGSGNISNNATLVFNHTDTGNLSLGILAGNITGTGNVTFISVGNISIDKTINLSGTDSLIKIQSNANVTLNSSLTSSGGNGKIILAAGAATAAGTATGGQIAINSTVNVTLNNSGSVVMFQGNNSANLTATLDARVVGANTTSVPKYKTYNASLGNITSAVTGTRNYFYRLQPTANITGGTVTATKVYDGTTTANPIYTGGGSVAGVDGDTLTGCVTGASYNTSSAGSNKTLTYNVALASNNSAWVVTGYAGTVSPTSTVANITQAPLTIQANDAADFVTLAASSGPFAGVSYSGFVHGENATTAGLTGTLNISRAAGNSAATYALTPSGLSANNYAISYRTGNYTIVPAQQLIIRVGDGTSVYGDASNLNVSSVTYLMPDNVTIVNLTPSLTLSSGLYSVSDGVGGTASFKLGLSNATLSGSNNAVIGLWNVGYNNLTIGGSNFNSMVSVGTQTITKRDLTLTTVADNKVYDGNTNATFNISSNRIAGDNLTLSTDALGMFASRNAANGTAVTVGNITISGNDASNYNLLSNVSTTTANITPKTLTLSGLTANNKVYDATVNASIASLGTISGVLGLDDVQVGTSMVTGAFSDKNVGNGKTVTLTGFTMAGAEAGNYKIDSATTTANITPKALTVSGLSVAASKVYDGTTTAAPLGTANLQDAIAAGTGTGSDGKAYSGDGIGITGTPVGTYNSKDVATAANVSISGLSLTGAGSGNYVLTAPAPLAATITPASLIIKANDDANFVTLAAASGAFAGVSYNGFVNNENTTTAGLTGTLAIVRSNNGSSAAGTYTLTPSGLSAGNYGISYQTGNYTIVPAQALLIRVSDNTSVYGNATSLSVSNVSYLMANNVTVVDLTSNLTVNNGLYSVSDGAGGSASFKVGLGNVTLSGSNNVPVGSWHPAYSDLNIVGNNFNTAIAVGTQTVTAKALTATATAADKTYNSNASASVTVNSTDVITGDNVGYVYTSAEFLNKNVGTNKAVTVANISLNGTDAGNYVIQNLVASTTANITQKTLNISGITAANKVYDSNTSAVVSVSAVNSTSLVGMGLVAGDNLTVSATGAFGNKNVGDGKTVTLTSTYDGADAGNYLITSQASTTANITQKTLTITGITADNKVYNGSNVAAVNVSALNSTALVGMGLISGDNLTVSASGVFDTKNVGTNKTVNLTSSYGGTDAGNYNITSQVNTTANITQKTLTITGITADDMVYNGSNVSVVNMTGVNSTTLVGMGLVAGDSLTVAATGAFANKTVGNNKTVTLTSAYSGADMGNYNITSQASTTANITQRTLTITGITAADRVYDGSNTSVVNMTAVNSTSLVGMGLVAGDSLTVAATGVFDTKNVGTNKTVNLTSAYSGTDVGNYNIVSQVNTTANVTQKTLTITGITADNKVYDGSNGSVVNVSAVNSTSLVGMGLVTGDNLTVAATGVFADKNVGTGKTVNLTSSYSGADAGNYNITSQVNTTANITQKALTITGITADNKVYDGSNTSVVNVSAVNSTSLVGMGLVAGDSLTVAATGAFGNKNVGDGKTVNLTSTYSGTDVGNYNITSQASTTANITQRTLTITGITAADKVYDGSNTSVVNASGVNSTSLVGMGLVAGDSLTVAATGVFGDKNAGTNKAVNLTSTYSGTDMGNYNIVSQANTTANISQKALTITGITSDDKVYDGSTTAVVNTSAITNATLVTGGMIAGDAVTITATGWFADKNVGTNKTVTLSSTYSGADAGNYNITSPANTRASIRTKALTITGITAANKVYDGDTTAVVNVSAVNNTSLVGMGLVAGDSLSVAATGAFADKDVGTHKTVTLNSTYSGTDVGNYNITSQASTWADITASTSSQNTGTGSGASTSTSTNTGTSASQNQPATVDSAALVKSIVPSVITVQPAPVTPPTPIAMPSFNLPEATTAAATDNVKAKETKTDVTDDSMSSQKALALVTQTRTPVIETTNTPTATLSLPATSITLATAAATPAATPSASVSSSATAAPSTTPPTVVASVAAPTNEVKVAPSGAAPPANQVASTPRASGVLPVSVLGDSRMTYVGMAFEEQPNDIRIQMTASPDVPKVAATGVRFAGNFKTFMVGNDRGEMVTYQGAMIGKRMVVVAETEASKNLARQDMQTVLAAAITTLGSSGSISLSQMEGVVLDLR